MTLNTAQLATSFLGPRTNMVRDQEAPGGPYWTNRLQSLSTLNSKTTPLDLGWGELPAVDGVPSKPTPLDRCTSHGNHRAGLRFAKFVMQRNSDFLLTPPQRRCHISSTCAAIGEVGSHTAEFLVNPRGAGDEWAFSPARRRGHPNDSLGGCPSLDEHLLGLAAIQAGAPRSGSPRCDEASVARTRGS